MLNVVFTEETAADQSDADQYIPLRGRRVTLSAEVTTGKKCPGTTLRHRCAETSDHIGYNWNILTIINAKAVRYEVEGDDGYVADFNYEGEARFSDFYESASFESHEYRPRYGYDSNKSNPHYSCSSIRSTEHDE
ncbi:uncharacterized protein LOC134777270 [Penaeus indicus]|uniref:uncharacterized protein LOC134777270 n=1 Tax=Penaeus indicus TaxID=29960 RepID=UPI00300D0BCC